MGAVWLLLLLLLSGTTPVSAYTLTLAWDAVPDRRVTGYRLHYGTSQGLYTQPVDVGLQTTGTLSGLTPGTYYVVVQAYAADGETSLFSNEVRHVIPSSMTDTIPPTVAITAPPQGARILKGTTVTIKATASDASGVTRVDILVRGVLLCSLRQAPYTCRWLLGAPRGTSRSLQAVAYDAVGNRRASPLITVWSR